MDKMENVSEFMSALDARLVNEKKITQSSANLYIRNLWTLNGKAPFKNLAFLTKTAAIEEILSKYAMTTQKTFLASIVSVLSLMSDKPTYKKVYQYYHNSMMGLKEDVKKQDSTGEKTEKQEKNWISWVTVLEKRTALQTAVAEIKSKILTEKQYNIILNFVVLSLYSDMPPRRNGDYSEMVVVPKWDEKMDPSKNYLDLTTRQFIFNKFKTAKKYGVQIVPINDQLFATITLYLKYNPQNTKKSKEYNFLVYADGKPFSAVNSITRILNKIFGLKIGSSMMRHIYLSDKYGDVKEEQIADSLAMGHSVAEQQGTYVKA